jgi:RNA-directed DNA polymerase
LAKYCSYEKTKVIDVDLEAYFDNVQHHIGKYINIEYAWFADDLVICVNGRYKWLTATAYRRLIAELEKIKVKVNSVKTKIVDLAKGDTFSFLGFVYRRVKTRNGKWAVVIIPSFLISVAPFFELQALNKNETKIIG